MRKYLGLTIVFFIIFFIPSVSAINTNLRFLYSDIGFDYACSYYQIENERTSDLPQQLLKDIDNDRITEVIGSISNGVWEYAYDEVYYVDVPYEDCTPYQDKNGTNYNCIINYKKEPRIKETWIEKNNPTMNKMEIKPQGVGLVRFCANINREYTPNGWVISIDHVPRFDNVIYDRFAWWNSTFIYRYQIIANTTTYGILSVNGSEGINGTNLWAWIDNSSYAYYYPDNELWSIANETNEKNWENQSSRSGNNPYGVYVNHNLSLVLHMESDSVAWDSSIHNNTGTVISSPSLVDGVFGQALDFDGGDMALNIPASASHNQVKNFSIEAWINSDSWDVDSDDFIAQKVDVWILRLRGNTDDTLTLATSNSGYGKVKYDATGWDTEAWHHVVATYNDEEMKLYHNGIMVNKSTVTGVIGVQNTNIYIASKEGSSNFYGGLIDEFRYYNKTLDNETVLLHYWNSISNHTRLGTIEEADTSPPLWKTNQSLIGYHNEFSYFNVSWIDDNFAYALFNTTFGGLANKTMTNTYGGNVYNYSVNFSETGVFYWNSYGNDTFSNENVTDTWAITIETTTTTTPIDISYVFVVNQQNIFSNDDWCIDNDTLASNITYLFSQTGYSDTHLVQYATKKCQFGCDNVTNTCREPYIYEYGTYFGVVVVLLIGIGIIIKLYGRW